MNKNTVTALILMLLVVAGFTYFSQPSQEQLARQKQVQDSIALAQKKQQAESAQRAKAGQDSTATAEADSAAFFTAPRKA